VGEREGELKRIKNVHRGKGLIGGKKTNSTRRVRRKGNVIGLKLKGRRVGERDAVKGQPPPGEGVPQEPKRGYPHHRGESAAAESRSHAGKKLIMKRALLLV